MLSLVCPPLPVLPCSTLPRCVKSNAALMNNAESADQVLSTGTWCLSDNCGSAELSRVSRQQYKSPALPQSSAVT